MRALLAALLLSAAAAIAFVPSAEASPGLRACVPPDPFQLGACVTTDGTVSCVLARVGPPVHGACVDRSQLDAVACLFDECVSVRDAAEGTVVCVPPGALNGACAGAIEQGLCAWSWLGANHSIVCVVEGPHVEACTTHLWDEDPEAWLECKRLA